MRIPRRLLRLTAAMLFLTALLAPVVLADDWYESKSGYYTVQDGDGQILFMRSVQIQVGDEYISGDNKLYRVTEVDDQARRAVAVYVEDIPQAQWQVAQTAQEGGGKPKVALYCTHTDESYVPSDGSESAKEKGGIVDVAEALTQSLQDNNVDAVLNDASHVPHDAGAYRRSRQTAVELLEEVQPELLLDIHRDGVPADQYEANFTGPEASQVRVVIGKGNQNYEVNKELAITLKQVADEKYPGLIKDIYLGKGSYNQDLMPNAILLEFGTHELEKEAAIESTKYMAEVIGATLGAQPAATPAPEDGEGQGGAAASPAPGNQNSQDGQGPEGAQQGAGKAKASSSAWKTVGIIAAVLVAGGLIYLAVFVGTGRRGGAAGSFFKELTSVGKPNHGDDDKGSPS